jgi:hypothetical protein
MAQITVSEDTFNQLVKRAGALKITVEQFVAPILHNAGREGVNGQTAQALADLPYDEWKKGFDAWMADVRARAHRYPPGFTLDDSRDSIYEGCGE